MAVAKVSRLVVAMVATMSAWAAVRATRIPVAFHHARVNIVYFITN